MSDVISLFVNDLSFHHMAIISTSLPQKIPMKTLGLFSNVWIDIINHVVQCS